MQLEVRGFELVLSLAFYKYHYRNTPCWLYTIWKFVSKSNLKIDSYINVHLVSLIENNASIMIILENIVTLSKAELTFLNKV